MSARLIVCSGRCLAAVIALSEASGWRLVGSALLADVLETMRLGMTPLVNAWKLPIKDDDTAADDADVAAYLGLCSQVCEAVSSFILSSAAAAGAASTKKGGATPVTSHARAVLKLQVTTTSNDHARNNVSMSANTVTMSPQLITEWFQSLAVVLFVLFHSHIPNPLQLLLKEIEDVSRTHAISSAFPPFSDKLPSMVVTSPSSARKSSTSRGMEGGKFARAKRPKQHGGLAAIGGAGDDLSENSR
jgi:hypothetical protein